MGVTLRFDETVPLPPGAIITTALGVNPAGAFSDKEIGKAVKMAANENYVLCANNDAVEGVVTSIEPGTVNNGYTHGGVQRWLPGMRLTVINNAATALVVGDFVKATAQAAVGTANASNLPLVQKGDGTEKFAWRVVSLKGDNGAQNKQVVIEAVSTTAGAS
jgi:hypothetical protein